ncbi:MAG: YlxR family protein [Nocardioidaceae bacterium]|nr:YlxR family protein [Nocardioidaceae bacterium]
MSRESVRTCLGCRRRAARHELLRVVAQDSGSGLAVVPDPSRRLPGRGAHLHPTPECLALALRRRAFSRALRAPESLASGPVEEYVALLG